MAVGTHILIDCYGDQSRMNGEQLDRLMTDAANAANATILGRKFHQFGSGQSVDGCGWTGVLILAESHITVHTWPEHNYASFDVYLCGACDAEKAADVIENFDTHATTRRLSISRGQRLEGLTIEPSANRDIPSYKHVE